jgi:hypothetical protein
MLPHWQAPFFHTDIQDAPWIAWMALLMPLSQGLVALALLLDICLAVDWRSYPAYGLRQWLTMRLHFTLVAAVCLLAGSVAA